MGIEDLILKKVTYDERMLRIPLGESEAMSDFMDETIAILTAQDETITLLQEQMANRMLCKKYDTE